MALPPGQAGQRAGGTEALDAPRRRLRATWIPAHARRYRRPGGPWDVPDLDSLLSSPKSQLVDGPHHLDHTAVEELVAAVAGGLLARGARRGRAVAWQLPNSLASAILYRACWRIGAVAAPLLHTFGATEAALALAQVEPVLTLTLDHEWASDPDRLAAALGGTPVRPGAGGKGRALPSDLAAVIFTSGSTGVPKAVLHTHRALSWKAMLMTRVHDLGPDDAVLMPAPLAHVSGLLNGILVPGAAAMKTVVQRRFDPEAALRLVDAERVTFMVGPPTFFVAMAGARSAGGGRGGTGSSLRLISSGGASVTPAFVEETAAAFGCRVKRTYGSTEAPTVTTSVDDDPFDRARDTDGRAVGEVELRISDPASGRRRRPEEVGELWVRGPELFAGYADAAQNAAAIAAGGWFRTGDLATVDPEGWLRIVGRLKDVIIRGGENIEAAEVEGVLESHPGVRQAVVVGYPDPLMGERVAAFVVVDDRASFDLVACQEWFAGKGLAKFKIPERVLQLRELPLLASGKPDRAALRDRAASVVAPSAVADTPST